MFYIGENSMGGLENNKEASYSESNNYENNFFSYNNKSQNQNKPTNFVLKSSENKQPEDLDGKLSPQEKNSNNNEKLTESEQRVENFLETAFLFLKNPTPKNLAGFNIKLNQIYNNSEDLNNLLENKKLQSNIQKIPSMDQKRKMINMILKPPQLVFTQRNKFINNILPTRKERKSFIKETIKSVKDKTPEEKKTARQDLSNYFLVYELIDTFKPTYSWNSGDKAKDLKTRQFFLKKAGIDDTYNSNNGTHNEAIRDWFLDVMMDIVNLEAGFGDVLDSDHQIYLEKFRINNDKISDKDKERLIVGLQAIDFEKENINKLTEESFYKFLKGLNEKLKKGSESLNDYDLKEVPKNFLTGTLELQSIHGDINTLLSQNKLSTEVETNEIIFVAEEVYSRNFDADKKKQYTQSKKIIKNEDGEIEKILFMDQGDEIVVYDKSDIIKNGGYELEVKRQRLRSLNDPEVNKQLDDIEYRLREAYKNTGNEEDLKLIRGVDYYAQVEQRYINTQKIESKLITFDIATKIPAESQQAWKSFGGKILENKVLDQEENKLDTLPDVSQKDLQNFKPIPSEYQKFIGSDGLLDKNLMDQNKIPAEKQQELLNTYNPEKTKNQLLQETNDTIKTQFTQQVVQFLQQSLNIQIDDQGKENILEQFNDIQNTMDSQNIIIEGNYQGQRIRFVYDLTTGDLQTNDWMSKDRRENNLKINSSSSKSLGIFGPNIKNTIDNAKTINYADIIQKSQGNIENYTQYCKQELFLKNPTPHIENQDVLKKQYLKTILNQEMIDLIGLQKPEQQKEINLNKYPIYNQIYQSVENYDIEELQEMRENLKQMKQLEDQITGLSENDELLIQETDNTAKKILLILFKEQKLEQQKTPIHRFGNHFLHFFNAMKTLRPRGEENVHIIDPKKRKTFLADVEESSAGERYPYDQEGLREAMSSDLAEINLKRSLKEIPDWEYIKNPVT